MEQKGGSLTLVGNVQELTASFCQSYIPTVESFHLWLRRDGFLAHAHIAASEGTTQIATSSGWDSTQLVTVWPLSHSSLSMLRHEGFRTLRTSVSTMPGNLTPQEKRPKAQNPQLRSVLAICGISNSQCIFKVLGRYATSILKNLIKVLAGKSVLKKDTTFLQKQIFCLCGGPKLPGDWSETEEHTFTRAGSCCKPPSPPAVLSDVSAVLILHVFL